MQTPDTGHLQRYRPKEIVKVQPTIYSPRHFLTVPIHFFFTQIFPQQVWYCTLKVPEAAASPNLQNPLNMSWTREAVIALLGFLATCIPVGVLLHRTIASVWELGKGNIYGAVNQE